MTILVLGIFVLFPVYASTNTICAECKGIANPNDCTTVSRCGDHETCFLEKYVTNDGIVLFDQGCKDRQICKLDSAFGKRSDAVVCEDCCDSKPNTICNLAGCNQPPPSLANGSKFCYQCPSAISPDQCNSLIVCNETQSCSITEIKSLSGQKKWKLGCLDKKLCPATQSTSCNACCDDNICNDRCNVSSSVIKSTQVTSPMTTMTTMVTKAQQTTKLINTSTTKVLTTIPSSPQPTIVSSPIVMHVNKTPSVIHYGDTVNVACFAEGHPTPTYAFKFKDGPLPMNANTTGNTLIIKQFAQDNVGRYECIAANSVGTGNYGLYLSAFP